MSRTPAHRFPRLAGLAAVALLAGLCAQPVLAGDEHLDHPTLDRFAITLGGFYTTLNTKARVDSKIDLGLGDRFDFENEIGLKDSDTLFRLGLEWRIRPRHQLNFGYFSLSRSASTTLTREIQFGDRTFPINVDVEGEFKSEVFEFSWIWWVVLKEKLAFGVSAGGVSFLTIDARLRAANTDIGLIEQGASVDAPVPLVGIALRYAMPHKFVFKAGARIITAVTVDDISGETIDLNAALEHRTTEHFGFGFSFSSLQYDVDTDKKRFRGSVEYGISGFQLYARLAF